MACPPHRQRSSRRVSVHGHPVAPGREHRGASPPAGALVAWGRHFRIAISPEVHYGVHPALAAPSAQGASPQRMSQWPGKQRPGASACGV